MGGTGGRSCSFLPPQRGEGWDGGPWGGGVGHVALERISPVPPYAEQESDDIGDDVIARLNPETGAVENLEVMFFSTRLLQAGLFQLPIATDLRLAPQG